MRVHPHPKVLKELALRPTRLPSYVFVPVYLHVGECDECLATVKKIQRAAEAKPA